MTRCSPVLSLALAAAASCLSLPALAQSTVSVYGLLDVSVGQFQSAGTSKDKAVESGKMSTSYVGFKGAEDLGGGLKAVFRFEHFLRLDTGRAGRFDGDAFWARDAFVGLSGDFGTTTLGRQTTPLFVSTLLFNPFGDSFGFSPSIRHYFTDALVGDSGWNNTVGYRSPTVGGASLNVLGGLRETASAGSKGRNMGANALYFGKALSATIGWQDVRSGVPVGVDKQSTLQLGAAYDFGPVKLYGQAGEVRTTNVAPAAKAKARLYDAGVSVPIGLGSVLAAYGQSRTEVGAAEITLKTFTVGYDYNLSKRTDVYAVYMNDRKTGLSDGNTYAAGIRHNF